MSVALTDEKQTLFRWVSPETRDQGNLLISHIRDGLQQAGLQFSDLGLLAVVTGPGSFTGIRIGIAAMRGIALATGLPLCGIDSFDFFAKPDPEGKRKNLVAVESWREELYFRLEGKAPVNLTPQDFAARFPQAVGAYVSGDAGEKIVSCLSDMVSSDFIPDAEHLCHLARMRGASAERPIPFYLREADITLPKNKVLS